LFDRLIGLMRLFSTETKRSKFCPHNFLIFGPRGFT